MDSVQLITDEWIDIIYISGENSVRRKNNGDTGKIKKYISHTIEIIWDAWGKEEFKKPNDSDNAYYNCKNQTFEIILENNEWNDIGVFNVIDRIIFRKNYPSEKGIFKFNNNELTIKWDNWGIETFYQLQYGKIYSNTKFGNLNKDSTKKEIKTLAIVFPQFHEIPENNKFWGKGFTEWTLLKNMPRIVNGEIIKRPHEDIGYFNLNDFKHREYMRILADRYNIYGFCYYHYWFTNKKVMYEPLEHMLNDGEPNKPFLLCWANEQWTKRWDGGNEDVLISQDYTDDTGNINHFYYLLQFFKHKNYIKKFNKPIFIFYRIEEEDVEKIRHIIHLWNNLAKKEGLNGIHFMRFLGPFNNNIVIPELEGFVEFEPGYCTQKNYVDVSTDDHNKIFTKYDEEIYLKKNSDVQDLINRNIIKSGKVHYDSISERERFRRTSKFFVYDGPVLYDKILKLERLYEEQHRGLSVQWNNTPRRNFTSNEYKKYPHYYKNINPTLFGQTFKKLLKKVSNDPNKDSDFLFISAWNEWNEQAVLEPNNEDGYRYIHELNKNYLEFYNTIVKKRVLIFGHKGGGTQKYIDDIQKIFLDYEIIEFNPNEKYEIYKKIDLIHINSVLFNNLKESYITFFNTYFINVAKYLTIHDYQWLYPDNPNILKKDFVNLTRQIVNIENFEIMVMICDKIIFPSQNIFNNYNKFINLSKYGNKIFVVSHMDKIINHNFLVVPQINNTINLAHVGNFVEYKGANIIKMLSNDIFKYKDIQIKYHIFGNSPSSSHTKSCDNIIYHNSYNDNDVIDTLHKEQIHGILHLSEFEESYCYALTNSINSGIPIFYFNHGAIQERLTDAHISSNKYFPTEKENINNNIYKFLDFIIKNQNSFNYFNCDDTVQPNRWYLTSY